MGMESYATSPVTARLIMAQLYTVATADQRVSST